MRARVAIFLALFATSIPSVAVAQGHPTSKQKIDEAMPHFNRGVELYDENDFANAVIEFKRAYEIAQDYHVLFNVSQTYYQLQNYAGALDAFQHYLTEGGAAIAKDRRAYVEKEIQRLRGRVAQVTISVSVPNAEISVDDEKVGTSPLDHAVIVSQGKRKITATVQGKPAAMKMIEVAGGDSTAVSLQIESEVTPPVPPPPLKVEMRRHFPWAAWGVTGGLFVVWGGTGITALVFSSMAQSKLGTTATASDITSNQNTAKIFALVSDISLGCTAVAAGVAMVMTLLAKPQSVERENTPDKPGKPTPTTSHGITARVFVGPTGFDIVGTF